MKKEDAVKRLKTVFIILGGYVLFYFIGRVLWVPMKDMTIIGWFTTKSPYDIQEYLYGWLWDKNLIWYSALISAFFAVVGKCKTALISYIGFVTGYVLGYFLGPKPEGAALGQGHYGWAIWGATFLVSIMVGMIVEKYKKRKKE